MVKKESHIQPRIGRHKFFVMNRYMTSEGKDNGVFVWFHCPGCDSPHSYRIRSSTMEVDEGPRWAFDYNYAKPTFTPSLLIPGRCHLSIRNGRIVFQRDSSHHLAGQTVDLPEAPDYL